jgi:hypothetical protein
MSCAIFYPPCGTVSTTTHLCTLLGGSSRKLHPTDYSWGILTKPPRAYDTESQGSGHKFGIFNFLATTVDEEV